MKLQIQDIERTSLSHNQYVFTYHYDNVCIIIKSYISEIRVESYSYKGIEYTIELANPLADRYYSPHDTMTIIHGMGAEIFESKDFNLVVARSLSKLERGQYHIVHVIDYERGHQTYTRR